MRMERRRVSRSIFSLAMGSLLAAAGCGGTSRRTASEALEQPPGRVLKLLPEHWLTIRNSPVMALSPDGTSVVFSAGASGQLYRLSVNSGQAAPLGHGQPGSAPFFSPDGKWVGFFAEGKLLKLPLEGGPAVTLCEACPGSSAVWTAEGAIIYEQGGLWRIPDSGGQPELLTQLSPGEYSHSWPDVLPGGAAVLYTSTTSQGWNDGQIVLRNLETGERRILVEKATAARYVPTGWLAYVQGGVLMAAPFDLQTLSVSGPARAIVENVMESSSGTAHYSFSSSGALAYVPGGILGGDRKLVWVDRAGTEQDLNAPQRRYGYFRLSPDGRTLAIQIDWPTIDIWLYDLAGGSLRQLTRGGAEFPWWTPDGSRVTFFSSRAGVPNLFWQRADGAGPAEQLTRSSHPVEHSFSWSPDGQTLAFTVNHPETGMDIWIQPAGRPEQARPYLQTRHRECCPVFSPDGNRLAYLSNQSGQAEVYVSPFPGSPQPRKVSLDGGIEPLWSRNGRELFFWNNDRQLMAVAIPAGGGAEFGEPRPLFGGTFLSAAASWRTRIDIAPDGSRFLLIRRGEQEDATKEIRLIPDWFGRLDRLPAAR